MRALIVGPGRIGDEIARALARDGYETRMARRPEVDVKRTPSVRMLLRRAAPLDLVVVPASRLAFGAALDSIEVDLKGSVRVGLEARPFMTRGSAMILFSDAESLSRPFPNAPAYHAAKAGVAGLTRALATAYAPDVRVNAVAPGPLIPPEGMSRAAAAKYVKERTMLGRWGGAEAAAEAVAFLARMKSMTGQVLCVDGGASCR